MYAPVLGHLNRDSKRTMHRISTSSGIRPKEARRMSTWWIFFFSIFSILVFIIEHRHLHSNPLVLDINEAQNVHASANITLRRFAYALPASAYTSPCGVSCSSSSIY